MYTQKQIGVKNIPPMTPTKHSTHLKTRKQTIILSLYSKPITMNMSLGGYSSVWIFQIRNNLIHFDEIRFWTYKQGKAVPL